MLIHHTKFTRVRSLRHAAVISAIVALSGCTVGPDFKQPDAPSAESWKNAETPTESSTLPKDWWTLFDDDTLTQLVTQSLSDNLDLQVALARVEQARATARQTEADLYPTITGGASGIRQRFSGNRPVAPNASGDAYTASTYSIPFDLSYEIDVWGRVRRSFESANAAAQASELDRDGVYLTVTGEVARTYFMLRSLDAEEQVLIEGVDLRKTAVDIIQGRFDAGVGNEVDLSRAQTELATTEADLRGVRRQRAAVENAIAVLCGQSPSTFTLPHDPVQAKHVDVPAGLPSDLLKRRPDIAAAIARMHEANAQIGVATAAFYPTFSLTGTAGFVSADLDSVLDASSRVWSLGPRVTFPIFEGGRNEARLRETEAIYREREASYRQTLLVAFREVEDSLSALAQLKDEIEFQSRAQNSADRTYELSGGRYRQGLVTYLEVVDAARSQLDARRARIQLQGLQAESTVLLIKALGGGWQAESSSAEQADVVSPERQMPNDDSAEPQKSS